MSSRTGRLSIGGVALLAVIAGGCQKDDPELAAAWTKHVEIVQKYTGRYPAYKAVFDQRAAEAHKLFEEAKAASDKLARDRKMKEAGDRLSDLFAPFNAYEEAVTELKAAVDKHASLPKSLAKLGQTAAAAQAKATETIGKAPANPSEAKAEVEGATQWLKDAASVFAPASAYLKAEEELKGLIAERAHAKLPAKAMKAMKPVLGAAKSAHTAAAKLIASAKTETADVKAKVTEATGLLAKAMEPLREQQTAPAPVAKGKGKAKPAPAKHARAKTKKRGKK